MVDLNAGRLQSMLQRVGAFGKSVAVPMVQQMLMPHILDVFAEHSADELETYILSNYPLVEKQTPDGVKNALENLGSNEDLRAQWEGVVTELVTPENIKHWLRNPEEWLDAEDAAEQREELKRCADVIEETAGGEQWLEAQVLRLYQYANIVPKETKPAAADD